MRQWLRSNLVSILSFIKVLLMAVLLILVISIQVSTARQAAATKQLISSTKNIANQINSAVKAENQNTNGQLSRVNAHLDCIVQFFSQPDRSQKAIENIDTCQLKATESAQSIPNTPKQQSTVQTPQTAQTKPTQPTTQNTAASNQTSAPQQTAEQPAQPGLVERTVQGVVSLPQHLIDAMSGLL